MTRRIGLECEGRTSMIKSKERGVESDNGLYDLRLFINPRAIILEGIDSVFSSPVKGKSMK